MAAHWPADRQCAGSVADLDAFAPLYAITDASGEGGGDASGEGGGDASGEGGGEGSGEGSAQGVGQARPTRHGPASLPISRILDWVA